VKFFLEAFLDFALKNPEAIALLHQGRAITYDQLEDRVATIGTQLKEIGIGPENVVALCMDKSPELIASMIGVWYAGAAFLLLDPSLPRHRLAVLALDARASLILTENGTDSLFSGMSIPVTDVAEIDSHVIADPHPTNESELAYIWFTSGTTGLPKGVLIEQKGVFGFLKESIRALGLGAGSRSLFYVSQSFDASLWDIGTALLSGGTLCLEPDDKLKNPIQLFEIIRKNGITHLTTTPAFLELFSPDQLPATLKSLAVGGEECRPELVRDWAKKFKVVYGYGPTEATVLTSLAICQPDTWKTHCLGEPITGVTYHVIDGELYIGGKTLARGYLNSPKLTQEKFQDKSIQQKNLRLYRTGDRVEETKEGLRFLGRTDRQLKLRGMRIEPGEIEATLREFPSVQDATVLKHEQSLAAFLIPVFGPTGEMVIELDALHAHLSKRLPSAMIPSRFEILQDAFPRTAAGKVDLEALTGLLGLNRT
jgi:amino acid adenylation domain-containing protein